MKFITFRTDGTSHVGALMPGDTAVVDLTAAGIADSMLDLIERFDDVRGGIRNAVRSLPERPFDRDALLAPIPHPRRNIFCVGKNYHEHAAEFGSSGFDSGSVGGSEVPDHPIIFTKPPPR
jgi:2-keto-4-pentenoate hydratase/2-oxohepta-3-ene-1,7-dioic acid hydratase in catechol pathway